MPKRIASVAAALALGAYAPADAQTLYKWIDADGKTQYSDKPPKGFAGTVTPLVPEYDKSPARVSVPAIPAAVPAEAPSAEDAKPAPPQSINTKRRENRLRLEARLSKARANVDAAKKAIADTETPEPDERQTIQQRAAGGGMHGLNAARSNCRIEVGKDGRKVNMCPISVPTPEYHERVARQEEVLRKAEEELSAAEEAWRRGVD